MLYTEVHWLLKGNLYCTLGQSRKKFYKEITTGDNMLTIKTDIFYLFDAFENLNMLNK